MKTIFWGLFLAWIHLTVNWNGAPVEILPVCIGWYIVLKGVRELPLCAARDNLEKPLRVMIALAAVQWCMNLFGGLGILDNGVGLLATFIELYVLWLLIELVAAIELMVSHSMPVESLRTLWKADFACSLVLSLLPLFGALGFAIVLAGGLAKLALLLAMLYQFWQAAKGYEEALAHPVELLPPGDPED